MTKVVRMPLAVGTMTAVMLIFVVTLIRSDSFNAPPTAESERVDPNAPEQAGDDLGLSADFELFNVGSRWFSDGVVRIVPILGPNFNLSRLHKSTANFAKSFMVGTSITFSDEELGYSTKHRYSYETGIQVYLSPMQYVEFIYGKRYEEDSLTTSVKTELRF